jgi:hypothetical protein
MPNPEFATLLTCAGAMFRYSRATRHLFVAGLTVSEIKTKPAAGLKNEHTLGSGKPPNLDEHWSALAPSPDKTKDYSKG